MPFSFEPASICGVIVIEPMVFTDTRGFFLETYKASDFAQNNIDGVFVQDNHSWSEKGVLRGLHFQQVPKGQAKLVRVVDGSIWDVFVDLRASSPTYKKWAGVELSSRNQKMVYIPPGFAHGFLTVSASAHVAYKCTAEYDPELDCGVRWNDPELNITWPADNPKISDKDLTLPVLKDCELKF